MGSIDRRRIYSKSEVEAITVSSKSCYPGAVVLHDKKLDKKNVIVNRSDLNESLKDRYSPVGI